MDEAVIFIFPLITLIGNDFNDPNLTRFDTLLNPLKILLVMESVSLNILETTFLNLFYVVVFDKSTKDAISNASL